MDPFVGSVVGALAAGALAAAKDTASEAVKDAYKAIREYITQSYSKVSLDHLAEKPASKKRQDSLAEDLQDSGAVGDRELASLIKQLSDAVKQTDLESASAVGFDLGTFDAEYAKFSEIDVGSGVGFRAETMRLEKGLDVGKLSVGQKN